MSKLHLPKKLVFTVMLAACNGGGSSDAGAIDGSTDGPPAVDGRPADAIADARDQDGCSFPCGGPFIDAAPGIDAAACPEFVCVIEDCAPPCQLLV